MIKITKLNKYFYKNKNNEIHVINNATLEFPNTGLVTIFGESGSGKTTLMNVIGGLDNFESGSITIDDFKINKYSSKTIDRIRNEKIGYIFQNYLLLQQRTVYENLKLVLNMYDISEEEKNERIDYVLNAVGMLKYKKKNVSQLSGGQQQRVAIARALIKAPSLILADEPTGNLDEKNTIQIMSIIKKISQNTLVILVSHEKEIANSYSDYIIEVEDGKIQPIRKNTSENIYKYEDDQNIYLQEYKYQKLADDYVDIDFYSNDNVKVSLQIVYDKGKFLIKSSNDVVLLDKESEIDFIDSKKQTLDANQQVEENDFELKTLEYVKTPSLSFKEKINLTFSNLSKMKKRTLFLAFPLIIIIALVLFSTQSVIAASFVDYQNIAKSDSHIYNIKLDKQDAKMNLEACMFGFGKFYDDFIEENPNIEPVLDFSTRLSFSIPTFTQLNVKRYELTGFSFISTEQLDEDSLIYGRMPNTINEIVVDKWVLENAINDSTLNNLMNVRSFINKEVRMRDRSYSFKIVGISNNEENTIYINKWAMLDIYPSDLKKDGLMVMPYSQLKKELGDELAITLKDDEAIININAIAASNFIASAYNNKSFTLIYKTDLKYKVVKGMDFGDLPYRIVLSDNEYNRVLKAVLASNPESFNVYCENKEEVKQVKNYINQIYEYYLNGSIKTTEEFGFPSNYITDAKEIKLRITSESKYDKNLQPYIEQARKAMTSRILITLTIIIISIIIIFFAMKSYAIKNIYDIGVYRALGIKKGSIVFVYALEILIISLETTFIGGTLCYVITNILAGIPIMDNVIAISPLLYFVCTFGVIILNVLVGILPIIMYLGKTPSQILTKYDV